MADDVLAVEFVAKVVAAVGLFGLAIAAIGWWKGVRSPQLQPLALWSVILFLIGGIVWLIATT